MAALVLLGSAQAAEWSRTEQAALAAGEAVWRHERQGGWQHGLAAIRVDAPPQTVLAVLGDVDAHVAFLSYVTASVRDGETAAYLLTVRGVTTPVRMDLFPDDQALRFVLHSAGPIAAGDGDWRVSPDGEGSLLELSVRIRSRWWVPGFIDSTAASTGLPRVVEEMSERAEGVGVE